MDIEFRNQRLALIQTDQAADLRLPCSVITAWHETVVLIRAAPDARTIRNWRSLGYERLEVFGQHSIRLNDYWRIIFEVDENCRPPVMIVIEIVECHDVFGRVEDAKR
jgi:toxin HigB-1